MTTAEQFNESIVLEVFNMIKDYADIICYDEDGFKDDLIHDSITRAIDIVAGDIKEKLTAKDVFNGWVKNYFDERYDYYRSLSKNRVSYSEDLSEETFGTYMIDSVIDYMGLMNDLTKAMNSVLSKRDACIVSNLYGLNNTTPKSVDEVAKLVGLSSKRVGAIKRESLRKLRCCKTSRDLLEEYYKDSK